MSYHEIQISKTVHNSPFKLIEESKEYVDAISSGNKIMAAVELSDLFCALKNEAKKLNISIYDLDIMSKVTERAFTVGDRIGTLDNPNLIFEYLKKYSTDAKILGASVIFSMPNGEYFVIMCSESNIPSIESIDVGDYILEVIHGTVSHDGKVLKQGETIHYNGLVVGKLSSVVKLTKFENSDKRLSYFCDAKKALYSKALNAAEWALNQTKGDVK